MLVPTAVWLAGDGLRPDLSTGEGRFLMGALVASPIAFQAYPVLFRPSDDGVLRRLGISGGAMFLHRAVRLLALALVVGMVLTLPFLRAGQPLGPVVGHLLLPAAAGWATSLYFTARAADRTVGGARRGPLAALIGWDPELARNAPLVYAPIPPVLIASFGSRLLGEPWATPLIVALLALLPLALLAARSRFRRAHPRFAPHSLEMAWAPELDDRAGELVTGRGLPGLLPRGAQLTLARDRLVADRRFRWAARVAPVVGVVGALALLRGGGDPGTRRWIAAAALAALLVVAGVVLALGRGERGRTRWVDRALGLRLRDRLIGRGWFAMTRSLAVALPVGIAWSLTAPGPGWTWWAGAAAGAFVLSGLSLTAAGR